MSAKLIAFVVTLLINIAAAIVILFVMLVAMNGFSESDAAWGLGAFVLLALIVVLVMSTAAFFLTGVLIERQFKPVVAALIVVPAFFVVGIASEAVCSLIGIGVAGFVRVNY